LVNKLGVALLLSVPLALSERVDGQRPIDLRDRGFRSGAELVTTPVTVRDSNGRLITTLQKSDFIVEEDGAEQPITQFTKERVPVSLALVLDTSDSMRGQRMVDARAALARFLDDLLAPPDEASLVSFNHAARVIAAWTSQRTSLRARLDDLRPSGGTAMFDAVDAALPLFESRSHPRAAIVLVSDGADTASDISPTRLKATLVRSDVFLYAIAIDSGNENSSTRVNPYTLGELSAQGGGYSEVIRTAADLGPATERIAEELNNQYMIGYTPTTRSDGKYHSVRVRVNNPEYKVRARRGVVR
jgi:Ca-activated chloride channel homolog